MGQVLAFILRPKVVLVAYLCIKAVAAALHGLSAGTTEAWGIGILMLLTYSVIAWFAAQRMVISIWAITILMLYDAAGAVLGGLHQFSTAPAAALIGFVVGVYMVMGALVVFQSRRTRA